MASAKAKQRDLPVSYALYVKLAERHERLAARWHATGLFLSIASACGPTVLVPGMPLVALDYGRVAGLGGWIVVAVGLARHALGEHKAHRTRAEHYRSEGLRVAQLFEAQHAAKGKTAVELIRALGLPSVEPEPGAGADVAAA